MEREEGGYWVFFDREWIIANYCHSEWYIADMQGSCRDTDFKYIDERQIIRP